MHRVVLVVGALAHANGLALIDEHEQVPRGAPSGKYCGSVPFILEMSVTFNDDATLDFYNNVKVAKQIIDCKAEKAQVSSDKVTFPNIGASGDCMGDALRKQKKDVSKFFLDVNSDGTLTFESDGWPSLKLKSCSKDEVPVPDPPSADCEWFRKVSGDTCAESCLDDPIGVCPRSIVVKGGGLESKRCADDGYTHATGSTDQKAGPCGTLHFATYKKPGYVVMNGELTAIDHDYVAPAGTVMDVTWDDCGAKHSKVTSITPSSMTLGTDVTFGGGGDLDVDESGGTFELTMSGVGGVSLLKNCKGDAAQKLVCNVALGPIKIGTLTYAGLTFPLSKGHLNLSPIVQLSLPPNLPSFALTTKTTLKVTDSNSEGLICVDIMTKPQ